MTNARHARAQQPQPQLHCRAVTPAAEINAQYNAFANDFATVEQLYVTAITEQSSSTVSVTATVTAAYTAGSSSIQVNECRGVFSQRVDDHR